MFDIYYHILFSILSQVISNLMSFINNLYIFIIFYLIQNIIISFFQQNYMFQNFQTDYKVQGFCFEKTAPTFGQTGHDESFAQEIQAEKEYVQRLKLQREKIQTLYSKYDILIKELKSKDSLIKQKDKIIYSLQNKYKGLAVTSQEINIFKQQNNAIKTQNHSLQKVICELQQSYKYLHGKLRTTEAVTQQKYEEIECLNDQLIEKVRSLSKNLLQKQQEFDQKYKGLLIKWQQTKLQLKKQKDNHFDQIQSLNHALFELQENCSMLKIDNSCLKQRVVQLQTYLNEKIFQFQQKQQSFQKERKIQIKCLKNQMDNLKEINIILQKKLNKAKDQNQLKVLSINQLSIAQERQEKQYNEILFRLRKQYNEQKVILKEQLLQCENHITKIQRKLLDGQRKQQCLYGKIKRYQTCLDAKRNLRQVQKQELQKISMLLSHP